MLFSSYSGSRDDCLRQQYIDHERVRRCGSEPHHRHGYNIRVAQLHYQYDEVRVMPYPTAGVPWLAGEHCQPSPSSAKGEDANLCRSLATSLNSEMYCSQLGTILRQVECCSTSSISCPTFLPPLTERPTEVPISEPARLQFFSQAISRSLRGDTVVAATSLPMEQQITDPTS